MANGIARMVAGGAAGGLEDEPMPSSPSQKEALDEIVRLIAPKDKPKSKVSDRKASMLMAQADAAKNEALANLRSAPAAEPAPRSSIARAAVKDNRFAPIAGSMGAGELVREDGTMKGSGFFGPIQHSSGRGATELGIESGPPASFNYTPRGYMNYPSMVPTLSREELATMMSGNENWPESIYRKAATHARERLAQGKSPFAQTGEQYPAPGYESQFMQQYPSAVMSYPDRTVGYQYAAGAPVTRYMSPVSSRPVPQSAIMSMLQRK
jgi:hypothetical protein